MGLSIWKGISWPRKSQLVASSLKAELKSCPSAPRDGQQWGGPQPLCTHPSKKPNLPLPLPSSRLQSDPSSSQPFIGSSQLGPGTTQG